MKLKDIVEMAYPTAPHLEFSEEKIKQTLGWFNDVPDWIKPIEDNNFLFVKKNNSYGLIKFSTKQLIGWVLFDNLRDVFGTQMYPIINIQILPEYRNTAAILVLLNAVRKVVDNPVYIDGPVFVGGVKLIDALAKRNIGQVYTLDKDTGTKEVYQPGDIVVNNKNAIIIEQTLDKLTMMIQYPGGEDEMQLCYFTNEETKEILNI